MANVRPVLLCVALLGCGPKTSSGGHDDLALPGGDAASPLDSAQSEDLMSLADFASTADLSTADLSSTIDLSTADLSTADLSSTVDLATADLRMVDLSTPPDMAGPMCSADDKACNSGNFLAPCTGGTCFGPGCCCPTARQCRAGSFPVCCPPNQTCKNTATGACG
jgi:hypothetical protein